MKTMAMLVAALAAASAFSFEDVQVTYRGRVRENGVAPAAQTVSMTFRLYAKKSDSAPSWTTDIPAVRIDTNGLFQVALRGEGLAGAIDAGRANWIGVSIGGGREQYPRQALTASPFASKATVAERLADSPSVRTASVARVTTKTLAVSALSVDGAVTGPSSAAAPVDVKLTKPWWTLPVKGNVRFFSGADPRDLGTQTASGGGCSFGTADCNCVALFTSESSDIMPGMSLFFKKNETITIPSATGLDNGTVVRCRLYKIGVE
ncbi:MAG: hypothetical protein IJH50_01190 [Kiritimatiellae bacterium]|nr:hypothetical protein [Kiritimatiellia bacterium]